MEIRMLKLALAAVLTAAVTVGAHASPWYIAHLGTTACVPLDVTPAQYARWLGLMGFRIQSLPRSAQPLAGVAFLATSPGTAEPLYYAFFLNPLVCSVFMTNRAM
jgi:hypothetical protein